MWCRVNKAIATSKMKLFVALLCDFQPSAYVKMNFILGVVGVLYQPLELYNVF